MANLHGGLERAMAKDKRQGIKDLVRRFAENMLLIKRGPKY